MKLLALSGSLRAASSNTAILRAAAALAPAIVEWSFYEGLAELPHFSPELDGHYSGRPEDMPDAVRALRESLGSAEGVLFCTPEYAFGIPGSLKNAIDWVVSSGELWRKPVAVLSASPSANGGDKAHAALLLTLTALEAHIVAEASLTIPFVRTKLNASGALSDQATAQALRSSVAALVSAVSGV
jgi:chromate reductase